MKPKEDQQFQEQQILKLTSRIKELEAQLENTESKLAINEEDKYKTLFNKISDLIFVIDTELKVDWVNNAAAKLLGSVPDEIKGRKVEDLFPRKIAGDYKINLIKVFKSGKNSVSETEIRVGEYQMDIVASLSPVKNEKGEVTYVVGWSQDITARKNAERALRVSEEKFRQLFDKMKSGVAIYQAVDNGQNFSIVNINNKGLEITKYKHDEVVGQSVSKVFPGVESFGLLDVLTSVYKTGKPQVCPVTRYSDDRLERWLENYVYKLSSGEIVAVFEDVTERRIAEQKIKTLNEELERGVQKRTLEIENKAQDLIKSEQALRFLIEDVNESREDLKVANEKLEHANTDLESFAYSVSHDLRAPIRHITGFTQLLKANEKTISEKGQKNIEKIISASYHMQELIENLLTYSRLGRQTLNIKKINVNDVITEIINKYELDIKGRKITWKINKLHPIYGDPDLIKIVFDNLLSNALKFTSKNEETIIQIDAKKVDNKFIEILIKDNGVGFDMAFSDKLFGVFQRLHNNDEFAGTGIGLANVKRIIRSHEGNIFAKSKVGSGATFFFTLPTNPDL
ncbi:MAG: PAS domain S-box protein [Bacteroidales bacterium]|nr:PAS domain S-box protein [Bacteroidales bacterium]MCF8405000.1 PAS domain S-box protein [Bacteroidales bacterium]